MSASLHAQSTVVDDTFADGERSLQRPPDSLAWYHNTASAGNLAVRNAALHLSVANAQRALWGYFPRVQLAVGEAIILTVDFQFTGVAPSGGPSLRLALCHTNGVTPRTTDGNASPTGNYQGYGSFSFSPNTTGLLKRDGPAATQANSALIASIGDEAATIWRPFGASGRISPRAAVPGTPYSALLRIARTGPDTVEVSSNLSGDGLSLTNVLRNTDTSNPFFDFDTIVLGVVSESLAGDLSLSRVNVTRSTLPGFGTRLVNLSVLAALAPGESFSIGYVVGGVAASGRKPILVRAAGPSLAPLGVTDPLADPRLELFAGGNKTGENDNWGGTPALSTAFQAVGAFAFAGGGSRDAAILVDVPAGDNSVRIAGSGTGTVIGELYDATPTTHVAPETPRLINVSVLKHLGSGLTAGFSIGGSGSKTILVRAIGPTLGTPPFHVDGVVADPRLVLFSAIGGRLAENDDWGGGVTLIRAFSQVGAFALPTTARDAALVATLPAGNYTVQVSGAGGASGVALVEIYELDSFSP